MSERRQPPCPRDNPRCPPPAFDPVTDTADPSDPPPLEPTRPEDYECCGNGCEPCVFDLHAQAVDRIRQSILAMPGPQRDQLKAVLGIAPGRQFICNRNGRRVLC